MLPLDSAYFKVAYFNNSVIREQAAGRDARAAGRDAGAVGRGEGEGDAGWGVGRTAGRAAGFMRLYTL